MGGDPPSKLRLHWGWTAASAVAALCLCIYVYVSSTRRTDTLVNCLREGYRRKLFLMERDMEEEIAPDVARLRQENSALLRQVKAIELQIKEKEGISAAEAQELYMKAVLRIVEEELDSAFGSRIAVACETGGEVLHVKVRRQQWDSAQPELREELVRQARGLWRAAMAQTDTHATAVVVSTEDGKMVGSSLEPIEDRLRGKIRAGRYRDSSSFISDLPEEMRPGQPASIPD